MFCSRCGTWASNEESICSLCGAALQVDNWPPQARARAALESGAGAPAPAVLSMVRYGGFWRRGAALVIDSVVLFFPEATMRVVFGLDPLASFDPFSPASWMMALFEVVLGWLYAGLLIGSPLRGTLGQQVMDLQVTDLHGAQLSFARASGRYLAQLLCLITLGVGYLVQLATPRRQALHDLASGTVVVRPNLGVRPMETRTIRIAP